MFIVERGAQILEFVNAVLDSIGAIARGNIAAAADKVENALAKALPLAISFLASLLGLGGITEKIRDAIDKVRKPIEQAVDFVVLGAVKTFKKMFGGAIGWAKGKYEKGAGWVKGKAEAAKGWASDKAKGIHDRVTGRGESGTPASPAASGDERTPEQKQGDLDAAVAEADSLEEGEAATTDSVRDRLPEIRKRRRLRSLALVEDSETEFHIEGKVNPEKEGKRWRKPADLPAWGKLTVDWDHIYEGHWEGTPEQTRGNNDVFWGLSQPQIKRVVRGAYENVHSKLQTQGPRIRVRGEFERWTVEMWVNKEDKLLETAYPIPSGRQ